MPLVPVLSKIERTGVRVDCEMLATQSAELAERIAELEAMAYEEAGSVFNVASPKQIQEILFEKMELPVLAKTPKGQPSTGGKRPGRIGRRARVATPDSGASGFEQTAIHLYRETACSGESRYGTGAYLLSPGSGGHRTPLLQ